ncbi:MAG TPA: type 4a pilus biogenesis protein PilO [Bryobacteraceae bacterium]|nr:type 4a pilus biogenesis protein PilO [Bryobacteraceae bacterium]
MPRNFNYNVWPPNNPGAIIRLVLGVLLAANLVAGYFVLRPIGGSPEELQRQATEMRAQIRQQQKALEQLRALAGKIEIGRDEGDKFMSKYFLPRRTAYATIMTELNDVAVQSKVTPKESSYAIEPVDGSDTLDMMQITANFEGTYDNLIHFVNLIDKSSRLLILESLNAAPQQNGQRLNVMLKVDTYVREDGSGQ